VQGAEELRRIVLDVLAKFVPEIVEIEVQSTVNFRDQVEMDSLDFLNFVLALEERFGIELPETDYPKLSSLGGCLGYLEKVGAGFASARK